MFDNIKAGDKVILKRTYCFPEIHEVEKVTPTGLIKVDGELYRPDSGKNRTSSIGYKIEPYTPKKEKELNIYKLQADIQGAAHKLMRDINRITYKQACLVVEALGTSNDIIRYQDKKKKIEELSKE